MPEACRRSRQLSFLDFHRFADQPSEPTVLFVGDVPCQSVVFGLEPAGIPLQRVEAREGGRRATRHVRSLLQPRSQGSLCQAPGQAMRRKMVDQRGFEPLTS